MSRRTLVGFAGGLVIGAASLIGAPHVIIPAVGAGHEVPDLQARLHTAAGRVQPSVVSVVSSRRMRGLFGGAPVRKGLGSGVIVDERGLILTNNHVVAEADELEVRLSDGSHHEARLVGRDPHTDIAVISIKARGLPVAPLGDSSEIRVADMVLAIGSPLGLERTVTSGIISAKGRARVGIVRYENFLQTDAAINQGNSGGPLVNLDGEVIGINTAILAPSGGSQGIGFAIPINMARRIMERLISEGAVERGFLGVEVADLDTRIRGALGYQGPDGVLVRTVGPQTPAARAGLAPGDVIQALDGAPVTGVLTFRNHIAEQRPGTTVDLRIWRDGRSSNLQVRLGRLPDGLDGS